MRPAYVQAFSCMSQPPLPTAHGCRTMTARAAQTIETPKVFTFSVDSYPWEPRNGRAVLERAYRIQINNGDGNGYSNKSSADGDLVGRR